MISDTDLLIYILTSIVIMMIFAFAVVWFLNNTQKKITISRMKEQERELSFQQELLENTVRTQEKERDRISRELHDDVASKLNIIHLNMHLLKNKVAKDKDDYMIIDHIETALSNCTERTRNISHELMPVMIKKFGIHLALKELQDSINISKVIDLQIEDDYKVKITDKLKTLHIYRIIQECINNTLKYADAKKVIIQFVDDEDDLIITYSDNGIGFDKNESAIGIGLSNINTRIRLLKGSMELVSSKGTGTEMTFKFPNHD